MFGRTLVVGLALLLWSGPAIAQDAGDPIRGKALAQQLCSGCHNISAEDRPSPHSLAPPFLRVSKTEGLNGESFANWLGTAHPAINGIAVRPGIAADILAHIRSLSPAKDHATVDPPAIAGL